MRKRYSGFGPAPAGEMLDERDGVEISRETLRKRMSEAGLWKSRRRKVKHREWRPRKECAGEMVQMDTSEHDWFEERGEEFDRRWIKAVEGDDRRPS